MDPVCNIPVSEVLDYLIPEITQKAHVADASAAFIFRDKMKVSKFQIPEIKAYS